MARPRLPSNVLDARGSFKRNPHRTRTDPAPAGKLRAPPKGEHFSDEHRKIWRELVKAAPKDVITESDRFALEICCVLLFQYRSDPGEFAAPKLLRLETLLGKFGMTPADRPKVAKTPTRNRTENPFSDLD